MVLAELPEAPSPASIAGELACKLRSLAETKSGSVSRLPPPSIPKVLFHAPLPPLPSMSEKETVGVELPFEMLGTKGAVFPQIILLTIVVAELALYIPPPKLPAELPEKVQLMSVVGEEESLSIPPPELLAALSLKTLFVTVAVELLLFCMPAPQYPVLLMKSTVSLPCAFYTIRLI